MNTLSIKEIQYNIVDAISNITMADSFVVSSNKIGGGNGEAKLYIGQRSDDQLMNFWGGWGFQAKCFMLKSDLISFLENIKSEYFEPELNYRRKNDLPVLWRKRKDKILLLDDIINFNLNDQIQIEGPRMYVNSSDSPYQLIRELSLPLASCLDIKKLQQANQALDPIYYIILKTTVETALEPSVEAEIENAEITLDSFFDPNKIKVRTVASNVGQIIDDLEDGIINLATEFQRLPNLWDEKKKSRFIESLLLKLPIPPFYFNEKEENDLEVVDGLQRVSTIKSFAVDKTMQLKGLEFLKEFEDAYFTDLPTLYSRRIKTFPIVNYIIEKGTPEYVKYNIFRRVNTGGLELTPQEIRHAINSGKASKLIAELVRGENSVRSYKEINYETELTATEEGKAFEKVTGNSIGTDRMQDRDFATRFVSFYLILYSDYEPDLDTFLNTGMNKINDLTPQEILKLKDDFKKSMQLAYKIFGTDAFRKRFNYTDSRKPINKALFEVLSVNFAHLSVMDSVTLLLQKDLFIEKFIALHNKEDGKFLRSITQGTAQKESVLQRFRDINNIIKETLLHD